MYHGPKYELHFKSYRISHLSQRIQVLALSSYFRPHFRQTVSPSVSLDSPVSTSTCFSAFFSSSVLFQSFPFFDPLYRQYVVNSFSRSLSLSSFLVLLLLLFTLSLVCFFVSLFRALPVSPPFHALSLLFSKFSFYPF